MIGGEAVLGCSDEPEPALPVLFEDVHLRQHVDQRQVVPRLLPCHVLLQYLQAPRPLPFCHKFLGLHQSTIFAMYSSSTYAHPTGFRCRGNGRSLWNAGRVGLSGPTAYQFSTATASLNPQAPCTERVDRSLHCACRPFLVLRCRPFLVLHVSTLILVLHKMTVTDGTCQTFPTWTMGHASRVWSFPTPANPATREGPFCPPCLLTAPC